MKHICISVGILVLILIFCLCSAFYVSNAVKQTSTMLEAALNARRSGDRDGSLHLVRAASSNWKNHESYFGTVLRHEEIDNIIGEFASLEAYARSKDQDDFYSSCASLLSELEHIEEMEWPFLHNIL